MTHHRSYGFSFSARRALGISAAERRVSRAIGVPLSRSGRRRRYHQTGGGTLGLFLLAVLLVWLFHHL